jgi:hypothetical protein
LKHVDAAGHTRPHEPQFAWSSWTAFSPSDGLQTPEQHIPVPPPTMVQASSSFLPLHDA